MRFIHFDESWRTCDKVRAAGAMIPHIMFEVLIKHCMYCSAPAGIRFITCPLDYLFHHISTTSSPWYGRASPPVPGVLKHISRRVVFDAGT